MACSIQIQGVVGNGQPGMSLQGLTVSGSATGCSTLSVSIVCTGQPVTHQPVSVVNGTWQTAFTAQELKIAGCLECASAEYPLTIRATCTQPGENCGDSKVMSEIPCGGGCPTVDYIEADVPSCEDVLAAGRWNVTFTAHINGSGVTTCLWYFSNTNVPVVGSLPQGGITTIQRSFDCPGEYTATLSILSPCEPDYIHSASITIELPSCGCPTLSSFEAEQVAQQPCTWHFEVKVGGLFAACADQLLWNFGDGAQQITDVHEGADHTYEHDGDYVVTVTLLGIEDPSGNPCYATTEISVEGCARDGGGGDDDDHKPCPWWDPRCWGSICGGLLALAMATLFAAGIQLIVAACMVLTPAVLATGIGAIWAALIGSALFISALVTAVLGFALLYLWYRLCRRMPGYNFCDSLNSIITAIAWIVVVQSLIALIMAFVGGIGCLVGIVLTFAYWGVVLSYLTLLRNQAGCN